MYCTIVYMPDYLIFDNFKDYLGERWLDNKLSDQYIFTFTKKKFTVTE